MKDGLGYHGHSHDLDEDGRTQGDEREVGKGVDMRSADNLAMADDGNEEYTQEKRSHVYLGSQPTWPLDYWSASDAVQNSRAPGHNLAGRAINMWMGMWVWAQKM